MQAHCAQVAPQAEQAFFTTTPALTLASTVTTVVTVTATTALPFVAPPAVQGNRRQGLGAHYHRSAGGVTLAGGAAAGQCAATGARLRVPFSSRETLFGETSSCIVRCTGA